MADRPWGERHHQPASSSSCRTPAAARRCLRRPRIALPLVIALFVFLALNPTVGRLWRGVHSCASQRWASLNDHQYELGESIHTLQSLGFRPHHSRWPSSISFTLALPCTRLIAPAGAGAGGARELQNSAGDLGR